MQGVANLSVIDLPTVLSQHKSISNDLATSIKPQIYFDKYLASGYYPYSFDGYEMFKRTLEGAVSHTIESDLAYLDGYDPRNANKIRQLMKIIADNAPFKPNLVKISKQIQVHRNTLISYFFLLEKAKFITLVYPAGAIVSILQKPERVYLSNSNLAMLLGPSAITRDALVNTFAVSQLAALYQVKSLQQSAFEVDDKWSIAIETGRKSYRKRPNQPKAQVFVDGIGVSSENKIPLWMLGFGY